VIAATGWPFLAVSGLAGALFGSFLNACVYRVPRGISIVTPPSACPRCGSLIRPYDNVPVLAWVWLGGRCRSCREPISPRYPVVEALTALVFAVLAARYGFGLELLSAVVFAWAMIFVTLVDFDARIIPDALTIPGTALGLLASLVTPLAFRDALIGSAGGFFLLWGIAWGYHRLTGVEGMGGGDIKLAALLGAFLGWSGFLLALFLASLAGAVVGGLLMILGRGGRRTALPFGTFLAPAGLLVYTFGGDILRWYLRIARG
jgi:leader peptidase (prepilin peptidase)/N-methyltransferase